MLSFERGRPIALIKGGKNDGKVVHIFDPDDKIKKEEIIKKPKKKEIREYDICCDDCDSKCDGRCCDYCEGGCFLGGCMTCGGRAGGCLKCCGGDLDKPDIFDLDPSDYISKDKLKKQMNEKITIYDIDNLERALVKGQKPIEKKLAKMYDMVKKEMNDDARSELYLDDGTIIPLPTQIKNQRDVLYCAAPSGAGKSTYIGNYIKQYTKMFPDNEIYVFSQKDEDEALDKYEPKRVLIDEDMIEEPIKPKELKNSLVIFDDIDTIQNKKLAEAVRGLRDELLETGRSYGIYMCNTSHQIMNYKHTRTLLNESNAVTFFPKAGSTYHIKRFLKEYCGLDKADVNKILKLPSRWVTISKIYPMYILYDKGVFLLNKSE